MPTLLHPRYWGAHLLMVLALAAAVALGLWQLHVWQAGRDAAAKDLSRRPALALSAVMGGDDPFPGQYLGQPVRFTGSWMGQSTLYVENRELHGRTGYWVVTPVLVGRSAMPVVRGWSATPHATTPHGQVTVTGWLQPSEGSADSDPNGHDDLIPAMQIASIVQHVNTDLYSAFVVERDADTTGGEALAQVTPESIPEVSGTDHLRNFLYAIQWWIFGGFVIYVWARWCLDQLERLAEDAADESDPDDDSGNDPEGGLEDGAEDGAGAGGVDRQVPSSA